MTDIKPKDFSWTWADNTEWPTFWHSEDEAKAHAEKTARDYPGVKVYIGTLKPEKTITLPDTLKTKDG